MNNANNCNSNNTSSNNSGGHGINMDFDNNKTTIVVAIIGFLAWLIEHFRGKKLAAKAYRLGFSHASKIYEKKLKAQAKEFQLKEKDWKKHRDEYTHLIHEYQELIQQLEDIIEKLKNNDAETNIETDFLAEVKADLNSLQQLEKAG